MKLRKLEENWIKAARTYSDAIASIKCGKREIALARRRMLYRMRKWKGKRKVNTK